MTPAHRRKNVKRMVAAPGSRGDVSQRYRPTANHRRSAPKKVAAPQSRVDVWPKRRLIARRVQTSASSTVSARFGAANVLQESIWTVAQHKIRCRMPTEAGARCRFARGWGTANPSRVAAKRPPIPTARAPSFAVNGVGAAPYKGPALHRPMPTAADPELAGKWALAAPSQAGASGDRAVLILPPYN